MNNPNLNQEKIDYLLLNGYERRAGQRSDTFIKDDNRIVILNGTADFFINDTGEEGQRMPGWFLTHSFTGIADIDTSAWMMLMHMTGAIPLRTMLKNMNEQQHEYELELMKTF